MLDNALAYAELGWAVFRIKPATKKPYPGSHGFKDAATNEILVTRMWDEEPDADIGMATGKISGVWVLDIDGEEGSRNLTLLENELGPLPETLEARTGGGGRHLFFKWPGAREVRNKQAFRDHKGIDIRGEGGYVVLAPSGHPSGQLYSWPYGQDTPIVSIPEFWLDAIAPAIRPRAPWEQPAPAATPAPAAFGGTPIISRARKYLAECEPAVQGSGGHDKLLWAARALVVGFLLEEATAVSLLWTDFNPRCSPPWDQSNSSERKDFERKVQQVSETPGEKPRGWLLDEYGLRDGVAAIANLAAGNQFAEAMLAKHCTASTEVATAIAAIDEQPPFPVNCFPASIADFCRQVAAAHVVDESFPGLAMLVTAGAAMGAAWKFRMKVGQEVPPLLWAMIVAGSGNNKTGPMNAVVDPLRRYVHPDDPAEPVLNPGGPAYIGNVTASVVVQRLAESPRGLMCFNDELAAWVKSFGKFDEKKGGSGDEQAWLEWWNAGWYQVDRKTNNEHTVVPAAFVALLGGIQPKLMIQCFGPDQFDSGLVPRLLLTCPRPLARFWSEVEIPPDATAAWADTVQWLRSRPFKRLDSSVGEYMPRILTATADAKDALVRFYNELATRMLSPSCDEREHAFLAKAQTQVGRLTLVHRGMILAEQKSAYLDAPIGLESVRAGIELMRWCIKVQMRIYGYAERTRLQVDAQNVADALRLRFGDKIATVREIQKSNNRKYTSASLVRKDVQNLVDHGLARWIEPKKSMELI